VNSISSKIILRNSLTYRQRKSRRKYFGHFKIIEEIDRIPELYLKYLKNTSGLYEIRVQIGSNTYRIFCFFDMDNLVIIGHGFQKKSQKHQNNKLKKQKK
jgi:phage-related protein